MSMTQVLKHDALTKTELHRRLREWLTSDEAIIGPGEAFAKSAWIHVKDGDRLFEFDPDTKRTAVEEYIGLVDRWGDELKWNIVPNRRGKPNAVAFGPDSHPLANTLYLYLLAEG